jgi:hypothetical protein
MNNLPTDLLNQASAALAPVLAQTVQQVAAQPGVQQAAHDVGVQVGAGAQQGAVSGAVGSLSNTAVVAIGVGGVLFLGLLGYAAYKAGQSS